MSAEDAFGKLGQNAWSGLKSFFSAESKEERIKSAQLQYGKGPLYDQHKNEEKGYAIALKVGHIISILLSYFCVYAFVTVPIAFIVDDHTVITVIATVAILSVYECLKWFASKKGGTAIMSMFGKEGNILNFFSFSILLMLGLCFGSYRMCKEGTEDLLAEVTDQTTIIVDNGDTRKDSIGKVYDATTAAAVELLNAELATIRGDKAEYVKLFGKRTWDNEVKQNVHGYNDKIAAKDAEIKALKDGSEGKKQQAISEVKVITNQNLEKNKGITALYKRYGYYLSLILEIMIIMGYVLHARARKYISESEKVVIPEMETQHQEVKSVAPKPQPVYDEDPDIHSIAKMGIFQLQNRLKTATEMNDKAAQEAAWNGLEKYKSMGYNINTGEYGSTATPLPQPIPAKKVEKKEDDAHVLYSQAIGNRRVIKSRMKAFFLKGEGDITSFMGQWNDNEDRIYELCDKLGRNYDNPDLPQKEHFLQNA